MNKRKILCVSGGFFVSPSGSNCIKMSMFDFMHLEKYKETNRIEAKQAVGGLPHSIWETYSAFANSDGGVILLGVAERKEDKTLYPVLLPDAQRLVAQFWDGVNNPRNVNKNILKMDDVTIEIVDGKEIVVIHVPKAAKQDKPIYISGNRETGAYYRRGESDIRIPKRRLEEMIAQAKEEMK